MVVVVHTHHKAARRSIEGERSIRAKAAGGEAVKYHTALSPVEGYELGFVT